MKRGYLIGAVAVTAALAAGGIYLKVEETPPLTGLRVPPFGASPRPEVGVETRVRSGDGVHRAGRTRAETPARGPQGEAGPGPAAGGAPPAAEPQVPEVPAPVGAVMTFSGEKGGGHSLVAFKGAIPGAEVAEFYAGRMPADGWELVNRVETPPFWELLFVRGGEKGVLTVREEEGQTSYYFTFLPLEAERRGRRAREEEQDASGETRGPGKRGSGGGRRR